MVVDFDELKVWGGGDLVMCYDFFFFFGRRVCYCNLLERDWAYSTVHIVMGYID